MSHLGDEFLGIPKAVRQARGVSWEAKVVACHLRFRQGDQESVSKGVRLLAKDLGMSVNTVLRALHEAADKGLLLILNPNARRGQRRRYDARPVDTWQSDSASEALSSGPKRTIPCGATDSGADTPRRTRPCVTSAAAPESRKEEEPDKELGKKRTPAPSAHVSDNGHNSNGPPDLAALAQRAWDASPRRPQGQTVADCERTISEHIAQGAYTARQLAAYLDATEKGGGPVEFWKLGEAVPRFAKRNTDEAWEHKARLFASAPKGYLARRKADGATGIVDEWCNEAVTIRVTEPVADWVRIDTAEEFDEWEFTRPPATAAPDGRQARQDGPQAVRAGA